MCLSESIQVKAVQEPSLLARYTCAGISCAIFAAWWKCTFVSESKVPGVHVPIHSFHTPLILTVGYLLSLRVLEKFVKKYCSSINMKALLKESMLLYNVSQIALNGWMVWRFIDALVNKNHPFVGDIHTISTGTTYAVWVHYCDKYLEFFDTYFMVLRGRMDQVSFLHTYHHFSIAWGWYLAMNLMAGGDAYFGALLNSIIHVLMYSYYALALLKISCPWKKYLTLAQLLQFTSVVVYSVVSYMTVPENEPRHTYALVIQVWEMVSLFILFSFFYAKSYGKRTSKTGASDVDQCQKAVSDAISQAAEVVEIAAKNAKQAKNSLTYKIN